MKGCCVPPVVPTGGFIGGPYVTLTTQFLASPRVPENRRETGPATGSLRGALSKP